MIIWQTDTTASDIMTTFVQKKVMKKNKQLQIGWFAMNELKHEIRV